MADQLGHTDPALTLRVYAHVLRDDEVDLSFADFAGADSGSKRLYPAPTFNDDASESRNYLKDLAPPAGLEPATHDLGNWAVYPQGVVGAFWAHASWQSVANRVLAGPERSYKGSDRPSNRRRSSASATTSRG